MRKRKYSNEEFIEAVKTSISIAEVFRKLGIVAKGGNYRCFHKLISKLNLDISHLSGQGHLKGKSHSWSPKIDIKEILVENSTYRTSNLRPRLIKELGWEYKCSIPECGVVSWLDKPITLHLDHINGINTDNRIENLRLLCPNCHSQTETYCVKNRNL